ncbi:MAG TPA: tetratricopeptide repeat protein [Archangium sp.]|jgi:tetratricopeptide (TPR) repeat protein|uniref:tetratricopeptide repeat protein n=1 Tax=Archangium sp. TaxID=1872627 RepID=UPI002ED77976
MVSSRFWGLLALAVLPACQTDTRSKVLVVPDEMRRTAPPSKDATRKEKPPPITPPTKYILRMAESGRVWEVELPEGAGGYEVRLPLAGGGPVEMLTPADEEMLSEALQDVKAAKSAEGKPEEAKPAVGEQKPAGAGRVLDAHKAARTRSYLGGVARVKEMYSSRRYELGLIELVNLETEYPNDARLLAMKGSLYLKLGQPKLARQAWEKALSINPDDLGVAEALRAIASGEE